MPSLHVSLFNLLVCVPYKKRDEVPVVHSGNGHTSLIFCQRSDPQDVVLNVLVSEHCTRSPLFHPSLVNLG